MADTPDEIDVERTLRFGIVCSGMDFPEWQARCIEGLISSRGVEPVLLIIDDAQRYRTAEKKTGCRGKSSLLWNLYEKNIIVRAARSTVLVDLAPSIGHLPVVRCHAAGTPFLSASDLDEVRRHNLDFVLQLSGDPVQGGLLNIPRFGVWVFRFGDQDKYRGEPPGFWEILKGDPVTGASLQRCIDGLETGVILRRGYFKTFARSYSRSRDDVLIGSADWPQQVCRDINRGRTDCLDGAPLATNAPIYQLPGNLQMLRFGWVSIRAWIENKFEWLFRQQQWNIGVIDAPIHDLVDLAGGGCSGAVPQAVRWLPEKKGLFMADPFAIAHYTGGRNGMTILAEEYPWAKARGRISIIESPDGYTFGDPRPVIEFACHMSYPFLFEHAGNVYCIPETFEAREISLLRAGPSLREWSKVATLVQDFAAVDSTVFRHDGRWWLLCTSQDAGPNSTLFAWHADELTGPWRPHAANPLKSDIRSGRPAGTPFVHDGQLYRPAQDCSTGYGAAVVINRVLSLTPEDFSEEVAAVLKPDPRGPYPYGLHTLCVLQDRTIIDGARRTFIPQVFAALIRGRMQRLLRKIASRSKPVATSISL